MSNNNEMLLIPKIELGIVIDHIPAGQGPKILDIIFQYEEMKDVPVTLGLNYTSKKLGKKDLIKLQMDYLAPEIIQHISIMVPGVTVKAVKDYKVHSKVVVHPPKEIKNLLECKILTALPTQKLILGLCLLPLMIALNRSSVTTANEFLLWMNWM